MELQGKKQKMKASESAPMETKQEENLPVENQTTNHPKKRFPWTMIIILALIFTIVAATMMIAA